MLAVETRDNRQEEHKTQNKNASGKADGIQKGITGATDLLQILINDELERTISHESINVLVLHSEEDSGVAKKLSKYLREECHVRAISDSELLIFKMMCLVSYASAAIEWADAVLVLVTEQYIDDVKSINYPIRRSCDSMCARNGFVVLRHKVLKDDNFQVIAAFQEGTSQWCHEVSEFRKHIYLDKDFSELGKVILQMNKERIKLKTDGIA